MLENVGQCLFLSSYTPKTNVIKLVFNNKDEEIQIINSKPRSSKIHDDTNNTKNPFSLNLWTYYARYLVN